MSHKAANQLWVYDNGYVKSRYNGLVLDIAGASKHKGAKVILYTAKGGRNQQWDFTPDGYLVSRDSGHVLDIPGGHLKNDVELIVYEKKDASNPDSLNQRWFWDEYGFIASMKNPNFVLDLPGRKDEPGIPLMIHEKHQL